MLIIVGIVIVLKDDFVYVSVIVGFIGSFIFGFILFCVFYLVFCKDFSIILIRVKDCLFIVFGIFGGVIGVVVII